MADDLKTPKPSEDGGGSASTAKGQVPKESPGGRPMGPNAVAFVAVYLLAVTGVVFYGLTVLWPKAGDTAEASGHWFSDLATDQRLLLIVLFAGALGGLVHSLRSFSWYLGNRQLYRSWIGRYVTLPVVGGAMAVVFYLVIRGGFAPTGADFDQSSPFAYAALAVLVGMFSEQAALRLKDIAETVFTKPPAGKDHSGPPTVTKVVPTEGSLEGKLDVTITGSGFGDQTAVHFGGKPATEVQVVDESTIKAKTPKGDQPGDVTVEVVSPGGQKGSLPRGFTYE